MFDLEIRKSQRPDPIKRALRKNKLSRVWVNDQVALFNETILNIMRNFIPNEIMIFDNRDPPLHKKYEKIWLITKNVFKKLIHHVDNYFNLPFLLFPGLNQYKNWTSQRENVSHKSSNKNLTLKSPGHCLKFYWKLKNTLHTSNLP